MRSYSKALVALIAVALLASACATTRQSTIASTGVALQELSEQYTATATLYTRLRAQNLLTAEEWQNWVSFATSFNTELQRAGVLWFTLKASGDPTGVESLETQILDLKNALLIPALEAVKRTKDN